MKIKIRGDDEHGSGYFGAPRGKRVHNGVDIIANEGEVISAFEGGKVTKIGFPYSPQDCIKGHLRYVEITVNNGDRHRYFYASPLVHVGDIVPRDGLIGAAQGLTEIYEGITPHYHFEIIQPKYGDPIPFLENICEVDENR